MNALGRECLSPLLGRAPRFTRAPLPVFHFFNLRQRFGRKETHEDSALPALSAPDSYTDRRILGLRHLPAGHHHDRPLRRGERAANREDRELPRLNMKRRIHDHAGEEVVLMSLIISIGMIALTVVGLWLWQRWTSASGTTRFF